ncbi:hypothetical protein BaRGS_00013773 [Batillaria attramentaria]|uniref:Death domain-containing protein n=1 Tax=Batillaria attramentaria TaxID=370345 RepID=A0ABD0L5M5_9CAEN
MSFMEQREIKRDLMTKHYDDFCQSMTPAFLQRFGSILHHADLDELQKRAHSEADSSVISQLLLKLHPSGKPWWKILEKITLDTEHGPRPPYPSSTPLGDTCGLADMLRPLCVDQRWRKLADLLDIVHREQRHIKAQGADIHIHLTDMLVEKFGDAATVGVLIQALQELGFDGEGIVDEMEVQGLIQPVPREGSEACEVVAPRCDNPYESENSGGTSTVTNQPPPPYPTPRMASFIPQDSNLGPFSAGDARPARPSADPINFSRNIEKMSMDEVSKGMLLEQLRCVGDAGPDHFNRSSSACSRDENRSSDSLTDNDCQNPGGGPGVSSSDPLLTTGCVGQEPIHRTDTSHTISDSHEMNPQAATSRMNILSDEGRADGKRQNARLQADSPSDSLSSLHSQSQTEEPLAAESVQNQSSDSSPDPAFLGSSPLPPSPTMQEENAGTNTQRPFAAVRSDSQPGHTTVNYNYYTVTSEKIQALNIGETNKVAFKRKDVRFETDPSRHAADQQAHDSDEETIAEFDAPEAVSPTQAPECMPGHLQQQLFQGPPASAESPEPTSGGEPESLTSFRPHPGDPQHQTSPKEVGSLVEESGASVASFRFSSPQACQEDLSVVGTQENIPTDQSHVEDIDIRKVQAQENIPAAEGFEGRCQMTEQLENRSAEGEQSQTMENVEGEQSETVENVEGEQSETVENVEGEQSQTMENVQGEQSETVENVEGEQSETVENVQGEQSETVENVEGEQSETMENVQGEQSETVENVQGEQSETMENVQGEQSETVENVQGEQSETVENAEAEQSEMMETAETNAQPQQQAPPGRPSVLMSARCRLAPTLYVFPQLDGVVKASRTLYGEQRCVEIVLLSEGPSLKERVKKNMPFLGRQIEPVQFFHDISPVLHEFDEMRLQRALERDIPPMLFHKIWEAVCRRIGWEETFIEALRQQRNPQLLHVLGLYVENAAPQPQPVMHQARGVLAASPENDSYYNASNQRQYCSPQVPLNYAPGSDTAACYQPEASSPAIQDQKLAMQSILSPECREKAKTESVKAITACLQSQHQDVALLRRTSHTPQNVDGREVLQAGFHGLPAGVTSEDRLRSPMGTTNTQFIASDNRQRSPLGTSAQFARQCQGAAPTHNPAHFPLPSPPPAAVAVGPPPSLPLQNFRGHQGRCMEPQGRYPDNIPVSIVDNAAQDQSISGTSGHSASKPQSSPLQDANVRQAAYAEIENLRPDEECLHHHHVTADSEELQPDADFSDQLAQQTMPPQSWSTTSPPLASRQASGADEPRPRMERHLTREASISDSQAVNINIRKLILNGPTAFGSKNTAQSIVGAMERESTQREGSFTHGVQVEAAGTNLAHLSAGTAADDGQHLLTESQSAGRMPSRESRPVLHNPVAESQSESAVPYPSDESESVRLSSVLFSETDRPADEMMTLKPPAEHFPIVRTDSYSSGVQEPGNPPSLHLPRDDPRHQTSAKTARNDLTDLPR